MTASLRVILHVDMDAFFAQAEVLAAPRLRGKPLVIGGRPVDRGVVASASYEARIYGVRSGMPLGEARKRCPEAVFLPCHPPRYLDLSARLLKSLLRFSPLVEMASIDEAFLDVTGIAGGLDGGRRLALEIQRDIRDRLGLGCSVGIGNNKLVAKMASPLGKPGGVTVLDLQQYVRTYAGRPVGELYGVGPATVRALSHFGVVTIGDLSRAPAAEMLRRFGIWGRLLRDAARGEDSSPVVPHHATPAPKSLGHEFTLPRDTSDRREIGRLLLGLSDEVGRDLRTEGWLGATAHLKVRSSDFTTRSRRRRLENPTDSTQVVFRTVALLFDALSVHDEIRMLGVSVSGLMRPEGWRPAELFDDGRLDRLDRAIDRLRAVYGARSLRRASLLADRREARIR